MKERPILFSGPMVKAILEGRKTQTRRALKPQPEMPWAEWHKAIVGHCRYGQPGDRLWVREAWTLWDALTDDWEGDIHTGALPKPASEESLRFWKRRVVYRASAQGYGSEWYWRPSIRMPRWASRITLEITNVRVERVQDIGEWDALEEGVEVSHYYCEEPTAELDGVHRCDPVGKYRELWDRINGKKYPWATNPWVFAISFRRIK